jgi:hypothetical protein
LEITDESGTNIEENHFKSEMKIDSEYI